MKIYLDNNLGVSKVEQEELTQDTIGYNILKVYIPNAVLTPYDTFTCYYGALLQNGRKVGWFAMEARTSSDADYEANYTLYKATLEQCVVSVEGKVYIGCQVLLGNSGNATLIKKNTAVVQFNVRKSVAINNDILVLDTDQTNTDVLESYKNLLENALLTYVTKASIADDLTTNDSSKVLSAKQGYVLKAMLDALDDSKADKADVYTKDETDAKDLNLAGQIAGARVELNNRINTTDGILTATQAEVAKLKSVQNVVEVVATKSALNSYDTSKLDIDDKVQVIADETHDGASTIYNWDGTQWQYVGAYGTNAAPKSTAITHTGNQLKDYNGNNIYPTLDDGQVNASKLASNSVETSKIKNGAVTSEKLANGVLDYLTAQMSSQLPSEVNDWLIAHPEATTTVQDGSITEIKLANSLKPKIIKDYITPEMFGANKDYNDNTEYIQLAIENAKLTNRPILLLNLYKITSPIIVDKSGIEIYGSTSSCGFLQMADGVDILHIVHYYQTSTTQIKIHNIRLAYQNLQSSSCYGLKFTSSGNRDGWGFWYCEFTNLYFNNCYTCVGTDRVDPVWCCRFSIYANNTKYQVVQLNSDGQLMLHFDIISNVNTYARTNDTNINDWSLLPTEYAVAIKGNCNYIGMLDIEDWCEHVFLTDSTNGSTIINQIHTERIKQNNYEYFITFSDYVSIGFIFMYDTFWYGEYNSGLIKILNGNKSFKIGEVNINNNKIGNHQPILIRIEGNRNPIGEILNYNGFRDALYSDKTTGKNIVIKNVNYFTRLKYSSASNVGDDIKKGEIYYNNDFNTNNFIGWVAITDLKDSSVFDNITVTTTAYSGTLVASENIQSKIVTGDIIHLENLNVDIVVTGVSGNNIYTSDYGKITSTTTTSIRFLNKAELLKPFGEII